MGVNHHPYLGTDATSLPLLNTAAAYGLKVINGFWLKPGRRLRQRRAYRPQLSTAS